MLSLTDLNQLNFLHCTVMSGMEEILALFVKYECYFSDELIKVNRTIGGRYGGSMLDSDCITQWKDSKGRTARDYAVTFKRDNLVKLLDEFDFQCNANLAIRQMSLNTDSTEYSTKKFNDEFIAFNQYVVDHNIVLDSSTLAPDSLHRMKILAFELARAVKFDTLRWLSEDWKLNLATIDLVGTTRHQDFQESIILEVLRGPRSQHFQMEDVHQYPYPKKPPITVDGLADVVRVALHRVLVQWDGQSDLCEYITSKRGKPRSGCYHVSPNCQFEYFAPDAAVIYTLPVHLKENAVDLGFTYIEQFLDRWQDALSETRIEMLGWMVRDLRIPLPPLHLFVKWGQFRLLRWACDEGLVDLSAPLKNASPDLLSFAQTLDWI
eukprot:gene27144-33827_t